MGIGLSFIFKNACSNAFDAIMFLFVTQYVPLQICPLGIAADRLFVAHSILVIDASLTVSVTRLVMALGSLLSDENLVVKKMGLFAVS